MKKAVAAIFCLLCSVAAAGQTYTLQQLKDSALHNNMALRAARYDIAAAQQQRREAFTKFFPNVSATGLWFNANRGMAKMDVNAGDLIPPSLGAMLSQQLPAEALAALSSPFSMTMMKNGTVAGISAVQPVFAGGQIVNGNKLAKVGETVSHLQLELSENEVEKTTEQYFWQIVSMKEKLKTVAAVDTLLADICKDVDVAVRAGVAMRNDLLQVQLRRNDLQSQKLKLQNGLAIVLLLLGQYCGLSSPSATAVSGEAEGNAFDIVVPDMERHDALSPAVSPRLFEESLLPEYQLLQQQVKAAGLQRKIEVGKTLPTVAIGAGYNYHNLLDNDRTFAMLFATVSVPISDWWGGSHAVKRRTMELRKAEEQLADNAELLLIRIQKSRNDVEEARQQLTIAQRSIDQAGENLRLNRDYYRAGTTKMSDLLEAQMLYQQACDKRTDAYADYQQKLLEYRHATNQK